MPSKSPAQARLMAAVAHDRGFAKRVGIPQRVGKEFNQADARTGILSRKPSRSGASMAKLSTGERKSLPKSDFGIPGQRAYPMPDKSHARNAKARASEMEHKGRISKATEEKIDAKANRKLGKGSGEMRHPRNHEEFHALGRGKDGF